MHWVFKVHPYYSMYAYIIPFCGWILLTVQFFWVYIGVELLSHIVTPCLTFWGAIRLFYKAAAPFCNPASSVGGFHFLSILTNLLFPCLLILAILMCETVSHRGFNLHFTNGEWRWTYTYASVCYLYLHLLKCLFNSLVHFLMDYLFLYF